MAVLAEHKCLHRRSAGDGISVFPDALDVLGDYFIGYEGPDTVVEKDDAVVRIFALGILQRIVDGILSGCAAFYNPGNF